MLLSNCFDEFSLVSVKIDCLQDTPFSSMFFIVTFDDQYREGDGDGEEAHDALKARLLYEG